MLNFPIPYPEELVYSTLARAGVHMGITSPKQLLDEVFNNRRVIATVDLPNYLERIAHWYADGLSYNAERLAYEHTLFPLYAPFTTESRRLQCLKWMAAESFGAVHLTLGAVASRLKKTKALYYCPVCMAQQLTTKGECYWVRQWQVTGANCCLQHGQLLETNLASYHNHRHQFFSPNPALCPKFSQPSASYQAQRVAFQVNILLSMAPVASASFMQWTKFYSQLAGQAGFKLGKSIQYDRIKGRVFERWPITWLMEHGLMISDSQTCWLRTIFRKHRKSFSYLEHIVVLESFLSEEWRIDDVIAEVFTLQSTIDSTLPAPRLSNHFPTSEGKVYRRLWLEKVEQQGAKLARKNGGGAIYAWLYRHDRDWLVTTNRQHQRVTANCIERVNWRARDWYITRQLLKFKKQHQFNLATPRKSRSWYLSQTRNTSSIEKNLDKLPLINSFFQKYCESVSDYQIRRISLAVSFLKEHAIVPLRWRILRKAGLSKERITDVANCYLNTLDLSRCTI